MIWRAFLMKRLLGISVLLVTLFAVSGQAQTRWLSRYWDGCKATCSWLGNVNNNRANLAKACGRDGVTVHADPNAPRCAKDGGDGYTCWDQIPFVSSTDPNLAYGFGATGGVACGQCFEVTFDGGFRHGTAYATHQALRGKRVIIMARNTGSDVAADQIDFMIPGGGLGLFDCFSGPVGRPASAFGNQYGGLLRDCEDRLGTGASVSAFQTCLRDACDGLFAGTGNQAYLRQGCRFYADFMMAANNPTGTVRNVQCPAELTARYGGTTFNPPPGSGSNPPPPVTTYTVNVSRSPTNAGVVRINSGADNPSQQTFNSGASVTVSAIANTGFRFVSWTAVSGTLPSGFNANAATNTIASIGANLNIRANFESATVNHNVTVTRNNTAGGSVRVGTTNNPVGAQQIAAGTSVTISATASSGWRFVNWTAASGTSLPAGLNATNASNTITVNGTINIVANFERTTTEPPTTTTFSVQAGSSPAAGGSVTINGNPPPSSGALSLESGARVTFVATANMGWRFVNWTAVGGGSLPTGFTATNATNTITSLSSSVNVRANFEQTTITPPPPPEEPINCTPPASDCLRLTRNIDPANAGVIIVDPATAVFNQGQRITVTAVANPGFEFSHWQGDDISGSNVTSREIEMWWEREITAHFREGTGVPPVITPPDGNYTVPASRTDTLKVEAEDFSERNAAGVPGSGTEQLRITTNPSLDGGRGITSIGWIEPGNIAVYDVGISNPGKYSIVFRAGAQGDGGFRVFVNDVNVAPISVNTDDWDGYTYVVLPADVELLEGTNRVRLEFTSAVNVDYFLLLTDPPASISVRQPSARAVTRNTVTIANIPRGFTASLPSNHNFTQYSVVDLRGRVLRAGTIGNTQRNVRISNMRSGVFFLRLEGAEGVTPQTFRAVTY